MTRGFDQFVCMCRCGSVCERRMGGGGGGGGGNCRVKGMCRDRVREGQRCRGLGAF